jgi:hypothetical protein
LNSDIPELHKLAAKRIYFEGITENVIIKLVLFRIENPAPRTDKDTKKWLKKSLCNTCRGFGSRALGSRALGSRVLIAVDDDEACVDKVVLTGSRMKRCKKNSARVITTIRVE